MTNKVVQIYNIPREVHVLPFVSCERHLQHLQDRYAHDTRFEAEVLGHTSAACEACQHDMKVRQPLEILHRHRGRFTHDELFTLVNALGFPSVEEAFRFLQNLDASYEAATAWAASSASSSDTSVLSELEGEDDIPF